jgi:epoxyqueuosine reductase
MLEEMLSTIVSHGDHGAVVSYSYISDIKQDMLDLKSAGYHSDWLDRMVNHLADDADRFLPPELGFEPRSLISVAMPCSKMLLSFSYGGCLINAVVPPGYAGFYLENDRVLQYLSDFVVPRGYSVAKVPTLPHKLLAVHAGSGLYGRNNIFYSDELGSYGHLMTYLSDMPCSDSIWFPLRRMELCDQCFACVHACPTGAIDPDRRLIDADRCLTYLNELPQDFPKWLGDEAHSCVVGCMKCQDCCPANKRNKGNIRSGASFTEEETSELLSNTGHAPYSDALAAKIEGTDIPAEFSGPEILPRNLAALLRNGAVTYV